MVGYYNYSVILTYVGLGAGLVGIARCMEQDIHAALICLMISGFCDMFDGLIASTCKRTEDEKSFGMHIDSLCDLVTFAVLPAMICYGLGVRGFIAYSSMIFYVLAAIIRLAYFDVEEINRMHNGDGEKRKFFYGLPVTNAAMIIPSLFLIDIFIPGSRSAWYPLVLFLIGLAFIVKFKMKKAYLRGLIIAGCFGVAVFVLICIFGGRIECLNTFTAA